MGNYTKGGRGFTLRLAFSEHRAATNEHAARGFDPEKVGDLAIVAAIVNHKVGQFAAFERADLVAAAEAARGVERSGGDGFSRESSSFACTRATGSSAWRAWARSPD